MQKWDEIKVLLQNIKMIKSKEYYIPHQEWEFSNFPIKIDQLKFEKTNWGFIEETVAIEVWRDEHFQLCGKISGIVEDFKKMDDIHFVNKGNIVKGQKIIGFDSLGNVIELKETYITTFHTNSLQRTKSGCLTEGELMIDFLQVCFLDSSEQKKKFTRLDWFVCNKIDAYFWEVTFRKANQKKVRVGLDKYDDTIENYVGSSSSKDYTTVKLPDIEFVIAKVPKELLPNQSYGLCIEFRDNLEKVSDELIQGITYFISFLLGSKINHIGYSVVDDENLIEANLNNIGKRKNTYSMPPIRFNNKYEWGDVSWLLNQFLYKYLELRNQLPVDDALSRYWIARNTPIGANLPILASALEMIAESYSKINPTQFENEYLKQNEYLFLIEPEISKLKLKLSSLAGGDVILNKILGAFRKGPNEKMKAFFSAIDIEIGKAEKEALVLRNKMAHAARDYSDEKRVFEDLVFTRTYEVLFHRIILKLLGYNEYYIDYSLNGCPLKHIDMSAGEIK